MKGIQRGPQKVKSGGAPSTGTPFRISRSKIELFVDCPRCFYLSCRSGVERPAAFPYTLNGAVDALLKREFDLYRAKKQPHPLMQQAGVTAVPFAHPDFRKWRDPFQGGIKVRHQPSGLVVNGLVDDVWVNEKGELHVVDYKATAKKGEVSLNAEWQASYKRQVEIYQWLLRKAGFRVSNTAYFVYCNADLSMEAFDARLEFKIKILSYEGADTWVDGVLQRIRTCLDSKRAPDPDRECPYCSYQAQVALLEGGVK